MVKKEVLVGLLIVLLVPIVYGGYEESVFNDVLYSGESVDINGDVFNFDFRSFYILALSVDFPDGYTLIANFGDCAYRGQYKVCFDSIKKEYTNETTTDVYYWLDIEEGEEYTVNDFTEEELANLWKTAKDYTVTKETYRISARIFKLLPKINMTRKISKTTLIAGEKAIIEIEFRNDGSYKAENVRFKDSFPYPNFKFEEGSYTGCTWAGESMKWEGDLEIGEKRECSYVLKAFEPITFKSKPEAKYYDGFETDTDYGSEVEFLIKRQGVNVDAKLSEEEASVDEMVILDINLSNTDKNSSAKVDFAIEVPVNLEILNKPSEMKRDGDYKITFNGVINADSYKDFQLKLKPKIAQEYKISLKNIYEIKGFIGKEDKILLLKVDIPKLKIDYGVSTTTLFPGQKVKMKIGIENPSNFSMNEVDVKVESDLDFFETKTQYIFELKEGISKELFEFDILAPEVEEEKEYKITTSADYKASRQYFNAKEERIIKVVPKEEIPEEEAEEVNETVEVEAELNETIEEVVEKKEEAIKQEEKRVFFDAKKIFENKLFLSLDIILVLAVIFLIVTTVRIIRPAESKPKSDKKIMLVVIIVIGVLLILGGVGWFVYKNGFWSEKKVEQTQTSSNVENVQEAVAIECGSVNNMHLLISPNSRTEQEVNSVSCFENGLKGCSPSTFGLEGGSVYSIKGKEGEYCIISTQGKSCKVPLGFIEDSDELVIPIVTGLSNVVDANIQDSNTGERIDVECI